MGNVKIERKYENKTNMNLGRQRILRIFKFTETFLLKRCSSKVAVDIDEDLLKKLESGELKPRKHPGTCITGDNSLPKNILNGIERSVGDFPIKSILKDADQFGRYLAARHPPPEDDYIQHKLHSIREEYNEKHPMKDLKGLTEEEIENYKKRRASEIRNILKQRVFAWRPIKYGQYESLVYAFSRTAQEYAILLRIFKEISNRDQNFNPASFFDFGSGVGSAMWAASAFWKSSILEYFNVDTSRDMNDLSDLILREGIDNKEPYLKNVYHRQFLPATPTKYDLVVSSFSLFELPNQKLRLETLQNLWDKCDQYLILVELGTRAGFNIIEEARDFIITISKGDSHVFSPCPHERACPRANADDTPCNFEMSYNTLPIGRHTEKGKFYYSYVVFKRGKKDGEALDANWPRIVRPTLVRSKHTICRMCTAEGKLQEIIFTASKHGKFPYRCARSSHWGDRLPITIKPPKNNEEILSNETICKDS